MQLLLCKVFLQSRATAHSVKFPEWGQKEASLQLRCVCVQVSEIMDPEAGHVHRDGVVLACEVLECCPWFEFADLDVYGNTTEEEADDLSTDPDELLELGGPAAVAIAIITAGLDCGCSRRQSPDKAQTDAFPACD